MKIFTITLIICGVSVLVFGQKNTIHSADSLFKMKNWSGAAIAYKKITDDYPNPKTGLTFNRLGTCYYYLGKFQEAVPAYKRAIQISKNPAVMYSLACVFNRMNIKDSCYNWLDRAAAAGFNQYQQITEDGDVMNLKNDPRFVAFLQKVKVNAMPCLGIAEYRQFDFWVGKWQVYDTKSNQWAGNSEITRSLGECVIMENWQPAQGMAGKSINTYNMAEKKWRQTYVDAGGVFSEYYDGEYRDGVMCFKLKMQQGDSTLSTMSFYKKTPDEIQQVGRVSKDHGITWKTIFDLTYRRE